MLDINHDLIQSLSSWITQESLNCNNNIRPLLAVAARHILRLRLQRQLADVYRLLLWTANCHRLFWIHKVFLLHLVDLEDHVTHLRTEFALINSQRSQASLEIDQNLRIRFVELPADDLDELIQILTMLEQQWRAFVDLAHHDLDDLIGDEREVVQLTNESHNAETNVHRNILLAAEHIQKSLLHDRHQCRLERSTRVLSTQLVDDIVTEFGVLTTGFWLICRTAQDMLDDLWKIVRWMKEDLAGHEKFNQFHDILTELVGLFHHGSFGGMTESFLDDFLFIMELK